MNGRPGERSFLSHCGITLKGFCMGIADLIPGISGGTIALILGIYEELLDSIKSFDLSFLKDIARFKFRQAFARTGWKFLAFLLIGIGSAIFSLSRLMVWLLEDYPQYIFGFFLGLILATVPMLLGFVKKWDVPKAVCLVASAVAGYMVMSLVPVRTPDTFPLVFLSGAIAICAMILPGISGSFMLVVLGKYYTILNAIHEKDIGILATFTAGIVVGILTFVRLVSWLLKRFHDMTMASMTGIVIGSLSKIWPWKRTVQEMVTAKGKVIPVVQHNYVPGELTPEVWFVILVAAGGFALAFGLEAIGKKKSA